MKKIDLGQTITILANVGVIAGIVFLAIELRQNNELLGQQARIASNEQWIASLEGLLDDPGLIELLSADPKSLDAGDLSRHRIMGVHTFAQWEFQWGEWRRGGLNEPEMERRIRIWRNLFHPPPGGHNHLAGNWSHYKDVYATADFIDWFEGNIVNR